MCTGVLGRGCCGCRRPPGAGGQGGGGAVVDEWWCQAFKFVVLSAFVGHRGDFGASGAGWVCW